MKLNIQIKMPPETKSINIQGTLMDFSEPKIMGILNVTPDSFYAASRINSEAEIITRVRQIIDEGGDIVDLGGQSSNPQSPFLSSEIEWERINFALRIIRREFPKVIISIDTFYADVAQKSVEAYGVNIINDISGGEIDANMFATVAKLNVPYILMHIKGTPQTMQANTLYQNFVQEVFYYFSEKITILNQLGVNDIIVDPGFGFSKTLEQNYELMGALRGFNIFDLPLLVGVSRKSMVYKLLGTDANQSINGTSVINTYALINGANILRVHDVKQAVEARTIMMKIDKKSL